MISARRTDRLSSPRTETDFPNFLEPRSGYVSRSLERARTGRNRSNCTYALTVFESEFAVENPHETLESLSRPFLTTEHV